MVKLAHLFFFIVLFSSTSAMAQSPSPLGVWLHPNQRIQVEITACDDQLCGRLIWFKWPNDAGGLPLVDLKNPDPALRSRPLLGLQILDGLHRAGDRTWAGGQIYNPDDGKVYRTTMTLQDDGSMAVRAFILLPIFGQTLIWTRVR
jgi:uncharacterized protein (DUF2147 family)